MTIAQKKVVIFDLDGTLVDSMDSFADTAARVMPRYYAIDGPTARAKYLESSGRPFFEQLEVIFPTHPKNQEAAARFEDEKKKDYFSRPAFPDTRTTLAALRAKGYRVVVSSNNFQELVDQYLNHANIEVDLALGWQPGFAKGEDHFKRIESTFGITRRDMIFVGDSLHDGERAKLSGIDFVGKVGTFSLSAFTNAFPTASAITSLSELTRII